MHLVILGLNVWALVFLALAVVAGYARAGFHANLGLLAAVIQVMSQSAVFALFLGAAKTLKETVKVYELPSTLVDRTSVIYFRLFPWALGGALIGATAAILGGAAGVLEARAQWRTAHGLLALGAFAFQAIATWPEFQQIRAMHDILGDLARAVPPEAEQRKRDEARAGIAARPVALGPEELRAQGTKLLTLGALALATLCGYRFVAQAQIPAFLFVLAALPIAAVLCAGVYRIAQAAACGKGGAQKPPP